MKQKKGTQDIAPVFVDSKRTNILHHRGAQTNPQLKLNLVDLATGRYEMEGVNITLELGAFLVKDNIYEVSKGFTNFLTSLKVTDDDIGEDENKIERFLLDIGYDIKKAIRKAVNIEQ